MEIVQKNFVKMNFLFWVHFAGWIFLGRDMVGAKRNTVWGEKNVPENALSRKFLDPSKTAPALLCHGFLYRKNRALTPEGGGKRTVRGGVQNPFLGGVSFVRVFLRPSFFHPPMASSDFPPVRKGVARFHF